MRSESVGWAFLALSIGRLSRPQARPPLRRLRRPTPRQRGVIWRQRDDGVAGTGGGPAREGGVDPRKLVGGQLYFERADRVAMLRAAERGAVTAGQRAAVQAAERTILGVGEEGGFQFGGSRAQQFFAGVRDRLNPMNYQCVGLGCNFGNIRYRGPKPPSGAGPVEKAVAEEGASTAARTEGQLTAEEIGKRANEIGARREIRVAEITGGRVAGTPGAGMKYKTQYASSDVDVIGPDGELIVVGGPAKAGKLRKLGEKMKALTEHAKQQGKPAKAYFTKDTPEEALRIARRWLGDENVILFEE
jgi:hypothetical protein